MTACVFSLVPKCDEWKSANDIDLLSMALHTSIGDPESGKLCRIQNATTCSTCNCPYYVKYSEDNGITWKGLSFSGTESPAATGCPDGGVGSGGTSEKALEWLKTKYIQQGYCGCGGKK